MHSLSLLLQASDSLIQATGPGDLASSVRITSIIVNGVVRVAAIGAGTYVVWLGHNTLVRGIKGDFEFSGKLYRLKGSAPGLLFVLLGCLAIGWALGAQHFASFETAGGVEVEKSPLAGTSLPPVLPPFPPDSS